MEVQMIPRDGDPFMLDGVQEDSIGDPIPQIINYHGRLFVKLIQGYDDTQRFQETDKVLTVV